MEHSNGTFGRDTFTSKTLRLVEVAYRLFVLVQQLRYLFSRSPHWHPLLALAGVAIKRTNRETDRAIRRAPLSLFGGLLFSVIITVRLAEWFLRSGGSRARSLSDGASMPCPESVQPRTGSILPPCEPSHCPICRKPVHDPCVSSGGYVFCYECLKLAIQRRPLCPVTLRPCHIKDVIRVYL